MITRKASKTELLTDEKLQASDVLVLMILRTLHPGALVDVVAGMQPNPLPGYAPQAAVDRVHVPLRGLELVLQRVRHDCQRPQLSAGADAHR